MYLSEEEGRLDPKDIPPSFYLVPVFTSPLLECKSFIQIYWEVGKKD